MLSNLGDQNGDSVYEELYTIGSRDGLIMDADTLETIADTGDAFEQTISVTFPNLFNNYAAPWNPDSDIGDLFDYSSFETVLV